MSSSNPNWTNDDEERFLNGIGNEKDMKYRGDYRVMILEGYLRSLKLRRYFGNLEPGFCEDKARKLLSKEKKNQRERERRRELAGMDWLVEGKILP